MKQGAQIYTDEYRVYNALPVMGYKHGIVPHADKIYVSGNAHTNSIEGFWSQAKNGIRGVYHAVSADYLQHYLDEYAFRYNHRNDVMPMFFSFLSRVKPSAHAGSLFQGFQEVFFCEDFLFFFLFTLLSSNFRDIFSLLFWHFSTPKVLNLIRHDNGF